MLQWRWKNGVILEEQILVVCRAHKPSNFLPQDTLGDVMFRFVTQENDKSYYVMNLQAAKL